MIYLQFVFGFILYSLMACGSYYEPFKNSKYFFPTGIALAIAANFIWLSIARATSDSSSLLMRGLYWDVMLTACYLIVPFLLFSAKVTPYQAGGILFIILGIVLTKI